MTSEPIFSFDISPALSAVASGAVSWGVKADGMGAWMRSSGRRIHLRQTTTRQPSAFVALIFITPQLRGYVEQLMRLRYLFASLTFRNKPVVKKIRASERLVEEVITHCPKPYRLMCYLAAKELNLNLPLIAAAGRDVPTAVALSLEDATTGNPHLPNFWRYIKTGDPGPDIQSLLDKWRKTAMKFF